MELLTSHTSLNIYSTEPPLLNQETLRELTQRLPNMEGETLALVIDPGFKPSAKAVTAFRQALLENESILHVDLSGFTYGHAHHDKDKEGKVGQRLVDILSLLESVSIRNRAYRDQKVSVTLHPFVDFEVIGLAVGKATLCVEVCGRDYSGWVDRELLEDPQLTLEQLEHLHLERCGALERLSLESCGLSNETCSAAIAALRNSGALKNVVEVNFSKNKINDCGPFELLLRDVVRLRKLNLAGKAVDTEKLLDAYAANPFFPIIDLSVDDSLDNWELLRTRGKKRLLAYLRDNPEFCALIEQKVHYKPPIPKVLSDGLLESPFFALAAKYFQADLEAEEKKIRKIGQKLTIAAYKQLKQQTEHVRDLSSSLSQYHAEIEAEFAGQVDSSNSYENLELEGTRDAEGQYAISGNETYRDPSKKPKKLTMCHGFQSNLDFFESSEKGRPELADEFLKLTHDVENDINLLANGIKEILKNAKEKVENQQLQTKSEIFLELMKKNHHRKEIEHAKDKLAVIIRDAFRRFLTQIDKMKKRCEEHSSQTKATEATDKEIVNELKIKLGFFRSSFQSSISLNVSEVLKEVSSFSLYLEGFKFDQYKEYIPELNGDVCRFILYLGNLAKEINDIERTFELEAIASDQSLQNKIGSLESRVGVVEGRLAELEEQLKEVEVDLKEVKRVKVELEKREAFFSNHEKALFAYAIILRELKNYQTASSVIGSGLLTNAAYKTPTYQTGVKKVFAGALRFGTFGASKTVGMSLGIAGATCGVLSKSLSGLTCGASLALDLVPLSFGVIGTVVDTCIDVGSLVVGKVGDEILDRTFSHVNTSKREKMEKRLAQVGSLEHADQLNMDLAFGFAYHWQSQLEVMSEKDIYRFSREWAGAFNAFTVINSTRLSSIISAQGSGKGIEEGCLELSDITNKDVGKFTFGTVFSDNHTKNWYWHDEVVQKAMRSVGEVLMNSRRMFTSCGVRYPQGESWKYWSDDPKIDSVVSLGKSALRNKTRTRAWVYGYRTFKTKGAADRYVASRTNHFLSYGARHIDLVLGAFMRVSSKVAHKQSRHRFKLGCSYLLDWRKDDKCLIALSPAVQRYSLLSDLEEPKYPGRKLNTPYVQLLRIVLDPEVFTHLPKGFSGDECLNFLLPLFSLNSSECPLLDHAAIFDQPKPEFDGRSYREVLEKLNVDEEIVKKMVDLMMAPRKAPLSDLLEKMERGVVRSAGAYLGDASIDDRLTCYLEVLLSDQVFKFSRKYHPDQLLSILIKLFDPSKHEDPEVSVVAGEVKKDDKVLKALQRLAPDKNSEHLIELAVRELLVIVKEFGFDKKGLHKRLENMEKEALIVSCGVLTEVFAAFEGKEKAPSTTKVVIPVTLSAFYEWAVAEVKICRSKKVLDVDAKIWFAEELITGAADGSLEQHYLKQVTDVYEEIYETLRRYATNLGYTIKKINTKQINSPYKDQSVMKSIRENYQGPVSTGVVAAEKVMSTIRGKKQTLRPVRCSDLLALGNDHQRIVAYHRKRGGAKLSLDDREMFEANLKDLEQFAEVRHATYWHVDPNPMGPPIAMAKEHLTVFEGARTRVAGVFMGRQSKSDQAQVKKTQDATVEFMRTRGV